MRQLQQTATKPNYTTQQHNYFNSIATATLTLRSKLRSCYISQQLDKPTTALEQFPI